MLSSFSRRAKLITATALGGVLALALLSALAATHTDAIDKDLVILLAPVIQPGPPADQFPQGSHLARLHPPNSLIVNLTPDFFATAYPRVSFDGTRLLFAGKRSPTTTWQIWEMAADGADPRQVTQCLQDCLQPAYLPRSEIVYTTFAPSTSGLASNLMVCKLDGSDAHPITFGPGDYEVETVLQNGTVLASARFPLRPANGAPIDRELYTLRPDGTGLATLRCDHQHPSIRRQARELDDGSVVFVNAGQTSLSLGGDLAWIRRGATHSSPITAPPLWASSPQPVAETKLLVTRESASKATRGRKLSLYSLDAATGKIGGPVYDDPKLSAVAAVSVTAHEPPRWYWSTLTPALQKGYFVCLNSYLAASLPHGRIAAKLDRVRVLSLDAATQKESRLGEAPVEEDGSFYIAVPPDQPVRFEVLDHAGRVVRAQRSWIWSRSGEEHGCVGCHEDHALAPENRWPMALRRFDTPTLLGVSRAVGSGQ